MLDIATLTPEEREILKAQLAEEPCDPIEELANAMDIIVTKVEALEERLGKTEEALFDKIIGGIRGLYDENVRATSISDLKGKYGSLFGPYEEGLGKLGTKDVYGALHEMLSKMKEDPGYTDEMGDSKIKEIAKQVADTFASLTGKPVEVETAKVEPAAEEKPVEEETEEDPQAAIRAAVERMKAKEKK